MQNAVAAKNDRAYLYGVGEKGNDSLCYQEKVQIEKKLEKLQQERLGVQNIRQMIFFTVAGVSEQVAQNSQSAKEISERVGELGTAISESNGKMHEMVHSMNEINEASQEIDKIIATINEIASQTNLLALNASIEAARAGEAGKGFAVVANQVNVLADQSAQAAKESAALIETSVAAVEKGMVIAGQTAEIQQINDVVQTNSATSEECAAASQQMSGEAENLRELIRKLQVAKFENRAS